MGDERFPPGLPTGRFPSEPPVGRFPSEPPVGRFAPSPTGDLHLGSALAALGAWASARNRGGRFLYRVEDIDGPRVIAGAEAAQREALQRLGLDWDEGPDVGGAHAPYRQSERSPLYEAALDRLAAGGRLFPCRRSRKELQSVASAPHGAEGVPPYPARFRPEGLEPGWYASPAARHDAALRFRVEGPPVAFLDCVFGPVTEDVEAAVGDFVLKRRDGVYAYQLAVVADDLAMGVTEVVRGADLLDSTARQIQLIRALGGQAPAYAHLPLVVNEAGEKLSKRDGALGLGALFEAGARPDQIVGWLAWALGQQERPEPLTPAAVAAGWDWARVRSEPVGIPADLAARIRSA